MSLLRKEYLGVAVTIFLKQKKIVKVLKMIHENDF